jgi:hypothetical protein
MERQAWIDAVGGTFHDCIKRLEKFQKGKLYVDSRHLETWLLSGVFKRSKKTIIVEESEFRF